MKLLRYLLPAFLLCLAACQKGPQPGSGDEGPAIVVPEGRQDAREGHISYQLLVYSFADSNGDGVGDFGGIRQHLDYLEDLGVSALWLSPIHPSDSYHGYDVVDYAAVNPKFGTEADFKALVDDAHSHGIKIYLDYVLNHTGKGNPWFDKAKRGIEDYRDWYIFSDNPGNDIAGGRIPMIPAGQYNGGEWHSVTLGDLGYEGPLHFVLDWNAKTLTVTKAEAADPFNNDNSVDRYLYFGNGLTARFYDKGDGIYEVSVNFKSDWGCLVRTATGDNWGPGTKWGAPSGANQITFGEPLALSSTDAQDIVFGKPSQGYFHGAFGSWMPDINYGPLSTASSSAPFQALAATADKWIGLGIDGMRLDAVKHIYHNETSDENPTFLKAWYDRCNTTFRKTHDSDFYMVGEVWMGADQVAPYYKGLPACFEFAFWDRLIWVLNQGTGRYFVKDILSYRKAYAQYRSDAIAATKLANHDETRAAERLNRNVDRMKQAAAILLTAPGEPYIYQGEELGYWGKDGDDGGRDEFVRQPIVWDRNGTAAKGGLDGHIVNEMLTGNISVEAQKADGNSLLNVYRAFTRLRNAYPALGSGTMTAHPVYNDTNSSFDSIAAWYMTSGAEKMLVIHNVATASVTMPLDDDLSKPVGSLGKYSVSNGSLTLEGRSSVVFKL